jgi:putative endonuclease
MSSPAVYILECSDGSLYTGSTNDLEKRLHEHNHLKSAAKYTRSRRPVKLVYSESLASLNDARKREYAIKTLTRKQKLELIEGSGIQNNSSL